MDWRCQVGGHPSLSLRETTFTSWRFKEIQNEEVFNLTLVVRSVGINECLVIMGITRMKILIILPIFWMIFIMKFGVIAEIGLEQCMRIAREITLFITLGIEIDRATTIIDGYTIDLSFGKGLMVVTHALKAIIYEEIIVASSNNELKATIHILWVAQGKVLIAIIVTI